MVEVKAGDRIRIAASVWDFCSATQQSIFIHDVQINSPVTTLPPRCRDISGIQVVFQLGSISSSVECNQCLPAVQYETMGIAVTDSNGVAYIDYTVTENDLASYNAAVASGNSLRVLACITNPKGQTVLNSNCSDTLTILPQVAPTHYISLSLGFIPIELVTYFQAYISQISDQLMTKISPPPSPWQYLRTTYDGVKNAFNIWFYLPPTAVLTMSPGALGGLMNWMSTWVTLILGAVLAIIGAAIIVSAFFTPITAILAIEAVASLLAGVAILSWRVYDAVTNEVKAETKATNLTNQLSQVNKENQARQAAEDAWQKSGKTQDDCIIRLSAHVALHASLLNGYMDIYAKYPDFITKLQAESTAFTTSTNAIIAEFRTKPYTADVCNTYIVNIDNEINASNLRTTDLLSTYVPPDQAYSVPCKGWSNQADCEKAECYWYNGACHKEENCWIPSPVGGCILSANTGKIIVGTVALIGILGVAYWITTRHPGEARAIITGAREAVREEAARARAAVERFRVPAIPGMIPAVREVPG